MNLLHKYAGNLYYLVPIPFFDVGVCESCNRYVFLAGLHIGINIYTLQIHLWAKKAN